MKRAIILLLVGVSINLFAQVPLPADTSLALPASDSLMAAISVAVNDSINISKIVTGQIEEARKKAALQKTQDSELKLKPAVVQAQTDSDFLSELIGKLNISGETAVKIGILGGASILVMFFILFRRIRSNKIKHSDKKLRNNINLIREEKVIIKPDSKLRTVRNALARNPNTLDLSGSAVSKKASELNIAKGEKFLAARIKSHELVKACSNK